MKLFSNCISKCGTCYVHFVGGCLAGHGDDDYIEITLKRAKNAIKKNFIKKCYMKDLYRIFPELKPLDIDKMGEESRKEKRDAIPVKPQGYRGAGEHKFECDV